MTQPEESTPEFEALLDHIRRGRGFDFGGYKRPGLIRRVAKRMQAAGVDGPGQYVDYLEVHPEEFGLLFDTILINVTDFFRDPPAWQALAEEIVPRMLASKRPEGPIRLWSAGCAFGEEAYSLAILLVEALGPDAFRDRVKIYATDVDEEALARARSAQYEADEVAGVPPDLLAKYFDLAADGRYTFQKDLRRALIFGRHDLIQDAPISRIDLLSCRNVLMYFNTETQSRILDRFHYALNDRAFLFLGKAETLMTYKSTFVPVDLKRRIFAKLPRGDGGRERALGFARAGVDEVASQLVSYVRLREVAFESNTAPQLVVEFSGLLALANDRARSSFGIAPEDLGRPFQDVPVSYRPADLRSGIDRAYTERRTVTLAEVEWSPKAGEVGHLDIHVVPLIDPAGALLGASITFVDATVNRRLAAELQASHRELEAAHEELRSTVEELETMNEELQSTNEELETVSTEIRVRSDELNRINTFFKSILSCIGSGVVVVDRNLLVQVWNSSSEELWGLRSDEVRDRNFLSLDFGLPLDQVRPSLLACLSGDASSGELSVDATNRRGKAIRCRVQCSPMVDGEGPGNPVGAVLLFEPEEGSLAKA